MPRWAGSPKVDALSCLRPARYRRRHPIRSKIRIPTVAGQRKVKAHNLGEAEDASAGTVDRNRLMRCAESAPSIFREHRPHHELVATAMQGVVAVEDAHVVAT